MNPLLSARRTGGGSSSGFTTNGRPRDIIEDTLISLDSSANLRLQVMFFINLCANWLSKYYESVTLGADASAVCPSAAEERGRWCFAQGQIEDTGGRYSFTLIIGIFSLNA